MEGGPAEDAASTLGSHGCLGTGGGDRGHLGGATWVLRSHLGGLRTTLTATALNGETEARGQLHPAPTPQLRDPQPFLGGVLGGA